MTPDSQKSPFPPPPPPPQPTARSRALALFQSRPILATTRTKKVTGSYGAHCCLSTCQSVYLPNIYSFFHAVIPLLSCLCFFLFLKVWWQGATLFVYFSYFYDIHTFIQSHSYNTFIRRHSLGPLSISSSLESSVGGPSLWCRAENRTRACLTASRRATN